MDTRITRREFMRSSALAACALPLAAVGGTALQDKAPDLQVHIFSKHLQFLSYDEMADVAASLGFHGVDLSVRPNGHVIPERVEIDLPKAVAAIKNSGLKSLLMTTAVEDVNKPLDKKILEVASGLGIKYYRLNWYRYNDQQSMTDSLQLYQDKVADLSRLNKMLNLVGYYQNHAGLMVGSSMWEIQEILKKADMGVTYDIRHATVEGGMSWQNGLRLIMSRIKALTIKDFIWEKSASKWNVSNKPLGEGMVDYKAYFKILKQNKINVPVTLHLEYPLGGAESGASQITVDKRVVFDAMKRDLEKLKILWAKA